MRAALALAAALLAATPAAAQPMGLAGLDGDRDGRITRAEYRSGFVGESMKFDRNGDGRVTRGELPALARLPGAKGIVDRVFRGNDADGDGALSRAELTARAEVRFRELDTTADGHLDAAEIKAARRSR
ncbi:MAG: hypothetical protein JNK30_22485 [Phenylobacterium sp.]|uniref:EF-hand domain-containing protein n=1 Tax=Phenylobacterium sp. TaxID=1871053 RepID=UPI001A4A1DE9|nr:hypothetical protein [Phenylobacterium sp.]MBL8774173.1 hypothetical protein [Phenylobacterium sp.]